MPWGSISDNFNPLNPGGKGATAGGTGSAIYEPMIYVNTYTGQTTDMLATSYAWSNSNKTLTMTTRQGVKWSDGKPFSAADVAYTFNLMKTVPALDVDGLFTTEHLVSVKAANSDTVVFQFSSPFTTIFTQLATQSIVPKHIWSKISNPLTFTNTTDPVGTGPFELASYSPSQVVYKKNPNYWQPGEPHINGLTMTAVKSNDSAELLLLNGDAAETFDAITDPAATYVAAHPAWNKFWWPVTGLNFLYMNTSKAPFSDPVLRKAIAMSINTTTVTDRAYFGAIPAANEADVTTGQVASWVSPSLSSLEWTYNPTAALALLESHGYKLVGGALQDPAGNTLPTFKILTGAGWGDFLSISQTVSQELTSIGISTTIDQEPWTTYFPEMQDGTFDLGLSWSNGGGPTPYYIYYYLLSSATSAATGSTASTNWERYTPADIQTALASYNATTNPTTQKADITAIEKDVLTNVPVIPLTGRPNFFDYSTRYFTGWPSASDPYDAGEAPDDFFGGAEQVYLNVHLK
jgi:peptide/nickel transport system substrate-binding protein